MTELSAGDFPRSTHNKYCDKQHENVCAKCLFATLGYLAAEYGFAFGVDRMLRDGWHSCGACDVAWRKSEECKHA